jgi:hypothetical protein
MAPPERSSLDSAAGSAATGSLLACLWTSLSTTLAGRSWLLRDYLCGHPDDLARYAALKRRLADLHDDGAE